MSLDASGPGSADAGAVDAGSAGLGFVGLGAMGAPIAGRLLARYGQLAVFDTRAEAMRPLTEAGAVACGSPAEVADVAGTVFVSLPDPEAMPAVVDGPDGLLRGRAIRHLVDLSTTGPAVAARLRELLDAAKVGYLDAPVSGGPAGAAEGRLTVMAAARPEVFAETGPLLDAFAGKVVLVGDEPGQGQLVKVLNNLMSASALAITSEALALAVKAGLDPGRFLDAVNAGSGRNTASADKFPRSVLPRTFDFGFRAQLMTKDVLLALTEAARQKVPMIIGGPVGQLWTLAGTELADDADCTEIAKLVEGWAGVTIGQADTDDG
jgi:3-hydroxyisobutyrate dehydrogenase-like beta-hydroxyacid dehydrogenase